MHDTRFVLQHHEVRHETQAHLKKPRNPQRHTNDDGSRSLASLVERRQSKMPSNKKQRGRYHQKRNDAHHHEAQKKKKQSAGARVPLEVNLQRKFGTPAIDEFLHETAVAAAATAAAAILSKPPSASSTAETKEENGTTCYHNSSAEHFVAGSAYLETLRSFVSLHTEMRNERPTC